MTPAVVADTRLFWLAIIDVLAAVYILPTRDRHHPLGRRRARRADTGHYQTPRGNATRIRVIFRAIYRQGGFIDSGADLARLVQLKAFENLLLSERRGQHG